MSNLIPTERIGPPAVNAGDELSTRLSVTFYPNTNDLAYIAESINKTYKFPPRANYALQGFLAINLVGLPAVLWYYDSYLAGLLIFLLNTGFVLLLLPAIMRSDYRRYFSSMFSSIEDDIVEVELTEDGVWCRHAGDVSFHAWSNIRRLEETKTAIYFFSEYNGLAVGKTGFAYDEEKDRFLTFAKGRVGNFSTT